jgi:hypothetical protein
LSVSSVATPDNAIAHVSLTPGIVAVALALQVMFTPLSVPWAVPAMFTLPKHVAL